MAHITKRPILEAEVITSPSLTRLSANMCQACRGEAWAEPGTGALVHAWAARFPSDRQAQAWLDGTPARMSSQAPTGQFTAINEADGLGDASLGRLYTLADNFGVAVGVNLYVRKGRNAFAVGLSAEAPSMTPGIAALYANPLPVGAGAVALIDAQLNPPDLPTFGPTPVPAGAVVGAGWPFQLAVPAK
jgi:hypothetical protein